MPGIVAWRGWRVRRLWPVALIAVLALGLRVGIVLATPAYRPVSDAAIYDAHGRSLAAGSGWPVYRWRGGRRYEDAYWAPGYPSFLAAVYRLSGRVRHTAADGRARWRVARIAQALLGLLAAALAGLVARGLWGRRAGLAAFGVAALYLPLALLGATLMTEELLVVLELAAVAAVLAAREARRPMAWIAAAGVGAGLAALTHMNAVVLLLPLAAGAAWAGGARTGRRRAAAVLVIAAVATIAPWTARNALQTGRFIPISVESGSTLAGTYNDLARHDPAGPGAWVRPERVPTDARILRRAGSEVEAARLLRGQATRYMLAHPAYVAEVVGLDTVRLLDVGAPHWWRLRGLPAGLSTAGRIVFWLAAALALLGLAAGRGRGAPRWVWAVPVAWWATVVSVSGESRFRGGLDAFVVLLAAGGVLACLDAGAAWSARRRSRSARPGAPSSVSAR